MNWLTDPRLFLCSQGGVVQVWKCKKMSSIQPMQRTDFDYVGDVKDHGDLLEYILAWKKPQGYQTLIDYISQRHLLVNSQGLVISELHGFGKDGKINVDTADSIYIRSLDVISLNTYIEKIRQQIPFRSVQYLEEAAAAAAATDINGTSNPPIVGHSPKELQLEADLKQANKEKQGLEKRLTNSEAKNKNLEGEIKRLTTDLATTKNEKKLLEKRIVDLEEANKRNTPLPMVRIYTKADTGYSLTIRDGHVILAPYNRSDVCQYWVKYDAYGTNVKDKDGLPSFALVNSFTGQAMKHSTTVMDLVQLIPYNPKVVDESILWTERTIGDGYSYIRTVRNIGLILDAEHGDRNYEQGGGVHDGTRVLLFGYYTGDNQKWKIALSSNPINI